MSSRPGSEAGPAGPAVRVDKWLWAVRVFRTRTAATTACNAGRVTIGDEPAKPAARISAGDIVSARRADRLVVYRVLEPIEKRVGAKLVEAVAEDLSPPKPPTDRSTAPPGGARERGRGRPTKKERRDIDRLRGRR